MEQFANNAASTLNGGINNSVTSLVVNSASGFPTVGSFRILIDSELMRVTGVSGTTFTVVRGSEGTSAVSHSSAAPVTHILTAEAVKKLRYQGNYHPDNSPSVPSAYDDEFEDASLGGAWSNIGSPDSVSVTNYPGFVEIDDNDSVDAGITESFVPGAAAFTVVSKVSYNISLAAYNYVGLVILDSSSAPLATLTIQFPVGTAVKLRTGFDGTTTIDDLGFIHVTVGTIYLMIQRDSSTGYSIYVSNDGLSWALSTTFTKSGTVDKIGLIVGGISANGIGLFDFVRTFPSQTFKIGA